MIAISPSPSGHDCITLMMVLSKVLVLAAVAAPLSLGAKDSDYYPPGIVNPNVNLKMYWKDAINVLQDLDKFESLHVLYHGCAYVLDSEI